MSLTGIIPLVRGGGIVTIIMKTPGMEVTLIGVVLSTGLILVIMVVSIPPRHGDTGTAIMMQGTVIPGITNIKDGNFHGDHRVLPDLTQ